ncbi:WxPxxD family membrane protein [Bacillus velezensis]|uniref:WxPxxD family membrane protein n=1 Tax=Bacillus velezensis TaxID=492670 RepID=UPI003CF61516
MKIKKVSLVIFLIIFFSIIWFNQNYSYLNDEASETLLYMNNSAFGYSSIMAYTLFYTIPFLITVVNFFHLDTPYSLIRTAKRKYFYNYKMMELGLITFIFSTVHTLVNLFYTYIFFDSTFFGSINFPLICLLNMISLMFYYLSVGIFFRLVYDKSNSIAVSIFSVYLFLNILFFVNKLYFPSTVWEPFKNLMIYTYMLNKQWSFPDTIFVYIRQLILIGFFYLIGSSFFLSKDIKK